MEKDYARELADRWALDWNVKDSSTESARSAIEGAIREALTKASEVCSTNCDAKICLHGSCAVMREAQNRIRALGVRP